MEVDDNFVIRPKREVLRQLPALSEEAMVIAVVAVIAVILLVVLVVTW